MKLKFGDVIRMLGFYRRKALFFGIIFLVAGIFLISRSQSQINADQPLQSGTASGDGISRTLQIKQNGQVLENNRKVGQVNFVDGNDEFRQSVLDQPGDYLSSYKITVQLPKPVARDSESKFLAIHGVDNYSVDVRDDSTVVYTATGIGPDAELSVVIKMPKGTISYPFITRVKTGLSGMSISFWLVLAIILPLFSFLVMLYIIFKELRTNVDLPGKTVSSPPMALPPAIVGIIVKQKIGPREIAATLVDLAIRGDIVIVDRERGFTFGKNRLEPSLIGYEKVLLGKIFRGGISANQHEIDKRVNNYLYSKKISAFYYLIQVLAARMGYLRPDYRKIKTRYSLLAISLFLLGVAGFLLKIFSVSTDPPYSLFFWIGMIISSAVIFALADYIPSRTDAGRAAAANWLAFKQYLSESKEIEFDERNYDLFTRYLPYAIVLECEASWARRFSRHNFSIPSWFITDQPAVGLEDFCLLLFPIVSYVGRNLDTLREPGI
jgi:hypothetical protein